MFFSKKINVSWQYLIVFAVFLIFITSCNTSRRLKKDQYLLEKVKINGYKSTKISFEEFESFLKQKPNRKFFGTLPFFVGWYNMFNDSVLQAKKEKRNEQYDIKNAKKIQKINKKNIEREKRGKKPLEPKLLNKEEPTTRENIRNIGEAPIVFDSIMANQTARQLRMFLFSKGYFNNKVDWCVDWNMRNIIGKNKKQKADLNYEITPGEAYYINHFTYTLEDKRIAELFYSDTVHSLIKRGERYDAAVLNEERSRITKFLLNNGYYFFETAYINYNVDSNHVGNFVSVELILRKLSSNSDDSIVMVNHTKFRINQIYVITEPVFGNMREIQFKDTTIPANKDVKFLHNVPLQYKATLIADFIKLQKGALFIRDTAEATFKSLLGLGIFKGVTVQFFKSDEFPAKLDCYIICTPLIKQSITLETELINTSGNRGIDGSLIYRNKNVFKGGEVIQLKLQGALTAQNQIGDSKDNPDLLSLSRIQQLFNTFQVGPEFTFSVPRAFFPFSLFPFKNEMLPRTYFKTGMNYQARENFVRNIVSFEYGLSFRSKNRLFKYEIAPFEIYSVKAKLSESFKSELSNLNDAFLLNSFIDHITTLSKAGVVYSSKENVLTSNTAVHYIRFLGMSSGSILREYFNLRGVAKDSLGRYNLFGIPFAHFLKAELEYRIYIPLSKKRKLVYRVAGGIGKTLANLSVLPYEQSFFTGGPNTIRAWRARTLGPGGYDPTNSSTRFDKIGDLLLEGNIEYRFPILKTIYGAVFADAGNIWRLQKVEDKPNGEFRVDEFYKQIALGGGVGLRWDLDFLILRFDFAIPIKDPKYAEGNRFTYNKQPWRSTVINFGIGYPF
ncbi:MAG: BamA/TamA family outer membrane protein [Bacteroidota bacterium]|nr:BamA/TamA family outer membrane protein [Bacteroidota bacterium]